MNNSTYTLFDLIRDPYSIYKAMRKLGPIHWDTKYQYWCVIDYTIARELFKDTRLSSDVTPYLTETMYPEKSRETAQDLIDLFKSWILLSDPPYHTISRKILYPSFSPASIAKLTPKIKAQTKLLLDAVGNEWDLVEQLSRPLVVFAITEILGLPKEDAPLFFQWNADLGTFSEAVVRTADLTEPALRAVAGEKSYFQNLIKEAVRSDKKSFIKTTYQSMQEMQVNVDDLWKWLSLLLIAGTETTRNLIGNGMLALLQHPSQFELLRDDPTLIQSAVEELLRFDAPIQSLMRVATEDIQVADVTIKTGQYVRFFYGAINRDPKGFENPDTLDITRSPNKHLSFGAGIHFCLGHALARLTASVCFSEVIKRFPNLKLVTQDPEWVGGVTLRGVKSLVVKERT